MISVQPADDVLFVSRVPLKPHRLLFKNIPAAGSKGVDPEISDAITTDFLVRFSVYVRCGLAPTPHGDGEVIINPDKLNESLYAAGNGCVAHTPDWQKGIVDQSKHDAPQRLYESGFVVSTDRNQSPPT
ncbi:hypothetical protein HRF68_21935 [Pseudomonas stutzeri]|nr:hypothetical protein [Stutzerimonas stutzeri]